MNTMVIPVYAPHPKLANKFILEPKIGAELPNSTIIPVRTRRPSHMLDETLAKPPIMPPHAIMKKLRFSPVLNGKQRQLPQQLWTEMKAQ